MKKLIIACAAVAMAAGVQAAAMVWNSGAMAADSNGTAIKAADTITMYVYEISASDFTTYSEMDGATLSKTIGGLYKDGKMPGTADGSAKNTYNARSGASAQITGTIGHVAGADSADAYALILFTDKNNADMYLANAVHATVTGSANLPSSNLYNVLGSAESSRGATAWASAGAVPEPTSGLLLLLGMAGLALRRRRA